MSTLEIWTLHSSGLSDPCHLHKESVLKLKDVPSPEKYAISRIFLFGRTHFSKNLSTHLCTREKLQLSQISKLCIKYR